jgi:uncharacterized repeat protein (TIGR02543 family)
VSFNVSGGSGTMANETEPYGTATALTTSTFTRTGYTFAGWNKAADGSGSNFADGASYSFTSSAMLYAQWVVTSPTVSFNISGGSGTMDNETEPYGMATALTTSTFTRTGYTFAGWNKAADGSGSNFADGASYPFTSSAMLYAQWVVTSPTVTGQPSSQLTVSGGVATFSAATSAVVYGVQWQVSSNGASTWSNVTGATGTSYNVVASSSTNDNRYRAVFTNASGSATSNAATLVYLVGSTNWSGYADTGATFSAVSGSWTVPTVTCAPTGTSFASQWVGIDGWGNVTVEQDGTQTSCTSGTPAYSAWYEMYGDTAVNNGYMVPLSSTTYPVRPGDAMSGSVSFSAGQWTLSIEDATQGWTFTTTVTFGGATQASAEWIMEAPTVCAGSTCSLAALADYGTTTFTSATASVGGVAGAITSQPYFAVQIINGSTVLSVPSLVDPTGFSFITTWEAA